MQEYNIYLMPVKVIGGEDELLKINILLFILLIDSI